MYISKENKCISYYYKRVLLITFPGCAQKDELKLGSRFLFNDKTRRTFENTREI